MNLRAYRRHRRPIWFSEEEAVQFRRKSLCVQLALAFGVGPALAQSSGAPAQRVEVTGSSIKRVDSESALPVTVITREQIEKSGAVSVEDLLHRVSASGAMFSDTTQGVGYATSNANLRGLGANSTLVLLNGRRMANHPFGSVGGTVAVDLNSIPFAALERIEVLRDGASAVYGSDAVGGVINFITRRDYRGGELSLRYGDTEAGIGGKETGVSLAFGKGDLDADGFNLLLTANLQKNTRVRAVDQKLYMRGLTEVPGSDPPTSGRAFPGRLVDYGLSPGAYISDGTYSNANFAACDPINTVVQVSASTTPNGTPIKRCRFIYAATLDNLPDSDKGDLYGRLNFKLSNDHLLYAEASFAQNHSIGRIAPVPIDASAGHVDGTTGEYPHFAMPVTSKYFPADLLAQLGYTAPFDTIPGMPGMTEIAMRAVPVGNRVNDNTNSQMRLVLGARGTLSDWDYDTGFTYSRASGHLDYFGYVNEPKFIAALATGKINPFGPSDAEGMALLKTTLMEGAMRKSTSTVTGLDGKVSRDLSKMDGGMMALAMGVDLRHEQADDKPVNDDYRQGLHIGGEGTVPATQASRNVAALFGEWSLPFAKGWEATLAARADHYSDFGTSVNPRASLRWQPNRTVLLRASAGTGFRAPSLWDVNAPPSFSNTANSLVDPNCPAGKAGDPRCETQFNVRNASTPGLKPEKSKQFALGMVLDPQPWLSLGLDYWHISKSDQIGTIGGDALMTDPALYAKYNSRIHRTADGFISFIDTPVENLGGLRTSGWDLSIKTRFDLAEMGRLAVELDGTYVSKWAQQNGVDSPFVSYLGTAGDGAAIQPVPRWQHTLSADWTYGVWGVRLENVFVKGWTESAALVEANIGVAQDYHVKDSNRFNLSASYSGFKNLTLRLGIRNLLDAEPPFTASSSYGSHAAGYAGSFTDPRGRFWYGAVNYKF
jgi:iron complex outermembrane receptor protein